MQLLASGKTKVQITVSEPWEFVSSLQSQKLSGHVVYLESHKGIVIELDQPLLEKGHPYRSLLAFPRHLGESFDQEAGKVFCNIVSLNEDEAVLGVPLTPASVRGDVMLMGDVAW